MLSVHWPAMARVTGVRWPSGRTAEGAGRQERTGPHPEGIPVVDTHER